MRLDKKLIMLGGFLLVSIISIAAYAATSIEYSTTSATSGNVIATLTGLQSGGTITNNDGSSSYTFTGNGSFTFEYSGETTTGSAIATVNNIDKTVPIGTMTYSPSASTTQNVTGTISFNESGVTITNNSGLATYTFTGNTSFIFHFHDAVGNTGSTTATVSWITGAINTGTVNTGNTNTGSQQGSQQEQQLPQLQQQSGTVPTTDYCPLTDKSSSTTDGKCYATRTGSIARSKYSTGINEAYLFAYSKGITDANTIQKALVESLITRKQFAKMASLFAMNVLNQKPNTGLNCAFTDMRRETTEMKKSAILACQLKIMGIDKSGQPNTKFNPNGNLTRAQLGTILSRLLRGTANDLDAVDYYRNHLAALKQEGIMTKIDDPKMKEKRGNIMLMLMRASQ